MVNDRRKDDTGDGAADGAGDGLEALFAEARAVEPGADLVARVLADAGSVQRAAAAPALNPARNPARTTRAAWQAPGWIAALGGWGGFGGVTAAGLVGLAVGLWSPDIVDALGGGTFWPLSGGGISPDLVELALESGDV